ncbi:MAG: hypothetical protein IMF19_12350, partial [Proteobacteria bacterium]|nr:hypothetical protein [Pseudomonadota bacterium]
GHKANKNFSGPLLVGAFKEPRIVPDPENISYGDNFSYSVNVIGSEKLNITLRYLCDGKWISEDITKPITREYTNITKWEPLNWTCKAINTWEDVKFDVIVTGEEIEVY